MKSKLLEVEELSIAYRTNAGWGWGNKQFVAVDNASFFIDEGETFSLVGESGSGKTTIGRAIVRLVDTASGRIRFDGRDITALGRKTPSWYRRDVQIIFQDPSTSLNPRNRVKKILDQVIARHRPGSAQDRVHYREELLDRVQLAPYHGDRFPAELSGGQKQRVAIAHALASGPRLVVCDEAVSALDVSTQGQILNLLADLQEQLGISYLFISHDLSVVRHVSRRVAVMYLGRILEIGDAEDLYSRPLHPYTKMLLASVLPPDPSTREVQRAKRRELRARPISGSAEPTTLGCPFATRCVAVHQRCTEVMPQLKDVEPQRSVACHLFPS